MGLLEVLKDIAEALTALISKGSYPAIVLTMAGESALLPIPSEVVMPLAGFLVSTGEMDFFLAAGCGVLGNLIGSLISYFLGLKYGREFLYKHGKYLLLKEDHMRKAELLFSRWGKQAVLLGRMLPGIRTIISFPAGTFGVPLRDLVLYTVIGSIPWNVMLVVAGVLLRENWGAVVRYSHHLLVLSAIVMTAFLTIKLRELKTKT